MLDRNGVVWGDSAATIAPKEEMIRYHSTVKKHESESMLQDANTLTKDTMLDQNGVSWGDSSVTIAPKEEMIRYHSKVKKHEIKSMPQDAKTTHASHSTESGSSPSSHKKPTNNTHIESLRIVLETADDMLNALDEKCEKLETTKLNSIEERNKLKRNLGALSKDVSLNDMFDFITNKIQGSESKEAVLIEKIGQLGIDISRIDQELNEKYAEGLMAQQIFHEVGQSLKSYAAESNYIIASLEQKIAGTKKELRLKQQQVSKMQAKAETSKYRQEEEIVEKEISIQEKDELILSLSEKVNALEAELIARLFEEESCDENILLE